MKHTLSEKKELLFQIIKQYPNLAVAFSGGVDSSVLLAAARRVLHHDVVAMTGRSPIHPSGEKDLAVDVARLLGVRHIFFNSHEMEDPVFKKNDSNRCYFCKQGLFNTMKKLAQRENIQVLAHGANTDDLTDHRPGWRASRELGIVAPLVDAGLGKAEIRQLALEMGLPNWDRPAMACLATRIDYGIPISESLLEQIDRAESFLKNLGLDACRVRHHGNIARLEVPETELTRLLDHQVRIRIVEKLRGLGYQHIAVDLEGYVSGKMNRGLP